jgi:hypothetical protein
MKTSLCSYCRSLGCIRCCLTRSTPELAFIGLKPMYVVIPKIPVVADMLK